MAGALLTLGPKLYRATFAGLEHVVLVWFLDRGPRRVGVGGRDNGFSLLWAGVCFSP